MYIMLRNKIVVTLIGLIICNVSHAFQLQDYKRDIWEQRLPQLRDSLGKRVSFNKKKNLELAVLIALSHYPELQQKKIKVIFNNRKGAPVEANFSPFNFIKSRTGKIYKIIIRENSFIERVPLNHQIAVIGHEMAHFVQYDNSGYLPTLFGLLKYVLSDQYRLRFEKQADKITVEHGLGLQMLKFAFYSSDKEIKAYMENLKND